MAAGTRTSGDDDGAAAPPPWAGELLEAVRAQARTVEQQAAVIDAQQAALAELQGRFDRLEQGGGPVSPSTTAPTLPSTTTAAGTSAPPAGRPGERDLLRAPTTRRSLMTRGAAVAAGAAVAGTVLNVAGANPAAAASGSFTGDPAVFASTTAEGGVGVLAQTGSGIGVNGQALATSGGTIGVAGTTDSPDGYGVKGESTPTGGLGVGVRGVSAGFLGRAVQGQATHPSGFTIGVEGRAASTSGAGVRGSSDATSGFTSGVYGSAASPDGVGVRGLVGGSGENRGVYGITSSPNGQGVVGEADSFSGPTVGVRGTVNSPDGQGVVGEALSTSSIGTTIGVRGRAGSENGRGLVGEATAGAGSTIGVLANAYASPNGWGVAANGGSAGFGVIATGGYGVAASSNTCQLLLLGSPEPPVATTAAHGIGEVLFDSAQNLWVCVGGGTPGTWRRLAGPATAGAFVLLPSPVRVYDSRAGEPPTTAPKSKLAERTPRAVDLTINGSGVPKGATGALVSLVAVNHTAGGFLTAYKDGTPYPGTSNVTFEAGLNPSVTTVVALSAAGRIALYANVATDVVVDVVGWYQ